MLPYLTLICMLQVVQDQKNPAFLAERKTNLEAYLKEVTFIRARGGFGYNIAPPRVY